MDSVKNTQKMENKTISHPQCQFFVVRKKRLCRMTVRPGRNYCGEHEPQPRSEKGKDDTRIPCPYDPKHTCYASKLMKHLTICNGRQLQQPDYIVHNVNAPVDRKPPPRKLLSQIPQRKILALIDKVNILYDKYLKDNITTIAEKPIHTAVLKDFEEKGRTESSLRHLKQASSLLHLMEAEGLVQNNTCYVELGAGKGQLSYYAYIAWCGDNSSQVVLVDRASLRHKRDNKLREPRLVKERENSNHTGNATNTAVDSDPTKSIITNNGTVDCSTADKSTKDITRDVHSTDNSSIGNTIVESRAAADDAIDNGIKRNGSSGCCRIRADLRHLALENVPEVAGCTTVVGFAKHLCGEATDYALRCITSSGVMNKVSGVVLATCCHHRCESATYIATEHLQEMGINDQDLNIMLGMVSWATCGDGRSRERRGLGRAADPSDERTEDSDEGLKIKRTKFEGDETTQFRKGVDQDREQSASQEYDHDDLKTKTLDKLDTVRETEELRKDEDKKDAMDTSELGASLGREANPSEDERQGNEEKLNKGEAGNEALGTGGLGLSAAQRQEAGRRAKALLDEGRARFLRARGLRARLAHFVAPRLSPENLCIVARAAPAPAPALAP